ncbi:MAG: hypothetical protein H5T41_11350, partial [Methanomassiliicoccales archaeon]|nr:hypothetical protein [Methanomassiliicoccales archaeon]
MKWKSNLEKLQFIFEQRYFRWVFLLLLMWSFFNSMAVALVEPLGFKYLFDEGIVRRNFRLFAIVGLAVVVFGTLWRLSSFFLELYARRFKNQILSAVSLRMLEFYHHLPYMEILRKGADYFVARIYDEAKNVTEPLVDVGTRLFQAVAMVIGALGLCFYLSPKLTGTLLIVITGLIYGSRYFGAKMQSQSKRQQEWEAELKGTIIGVVHAVKETR